MIIDQNFIPDWKLRNETELSDFRSIENCLFHLQKSTQNPENQQLNKNDLMNFHKSQAE